MSDNKEALLALADWMEKYSAELAWMYHQTIAIQFDNAETEVEIGFYPDCDSIRKLASQSEEDHGIQ